MTSKEKVPPCPQNGQAVQRDQRQYDPALCPPWCDRQHLKTAPESPGSPGDFHHDAPARVVVPAMTDDKPVTIGTSQFDPGDGRGAHAPCVEVQVGNLVALLSRDEAVEVATALLVSAEQTEQEAGRG